MTPTSWSRITAALGFLVACAVGVVTNIVTNNFTWTLVVVLAVLVVSGMIIAAIQVRARSARVKLKVGRQARLSSSPSNLSGDAAVDDRVMGRGEISRSGIDAETGEVKRRVRGTVTDSNINIKE